MTVITPPILNPGQVVETDISDGEVTNIKIANPQVTIGTHVVPLGSTLLLDTDDVSEAGNLYYTDARVDARLSSGAVVDIDVSGLVIDASSITTSAPTLLIEGSNIVRLNSTNSYVSIIGDSAAYVSTTNGGGAAGLTFIRNTIGSWSNDSVQFDEVINLINLGADPVGVAGDMYFNTTTNKFRGYNGTAWVDLG